MVAYERVFDLRQKNLGSSHPLFGQALCNYTVLLWQTDCRTAAAELEIQTDAILEGVETLEL